MITIGINQNLDKEVYLDFADFAVAGMDFGARIRRDHPTVTRENYEQYITDFYKKNDTLLQSAVAELQSHLDQTQAEFFAAAQAVYQKDYSNQVFTGALSIFDCNPRYPERNLFQVYSQRDLLGKGEVAFHEVMHFLFFHYCAEHCADVIAGYDQNSGPYWELSEIWNVIILNEPAFQNILKREEHMFYPHLEAALPQARKIWTESRSVREWVVKMLP